MAVGNLQAIYLVDLEQLSLMITGLACGILFACSTELEEDGDRFGDYLQQALINKH